MGLAMSAHPKSGVTVALDVIRNLLSVGATVYVGWLVWDWNAIVAVVACVPAYVVALNLAGFLTRPLYALTPEARAARKTEKEMGL
jgi:hypothetical protein